MSQLELKATRVFQDNYNAFYNSDKLYIVNEGGSRSSKTHSICQLLIIHALKTPGIKIRVARKTHVAVSKSVYSTDFIPMLKDLGIYNEKNHRRGSTSYTFDNGSSISFIGANDGQALRGTKQDILWLNEANELDWEEFKQLMMRLGRPGVLTKCIIDFNPLDIEHFLYELPIEKKVVIHSTYKDNPYLSQEQVDFIEDMKISDPTGYQVFCLGLRTTSEENVYRDWETVSEKPSYLTDYIYGLDFGFSHPMAFMKIWYNTELMECYIQEIIYEKQMESDDYIPIMNAYGITKQDIIIADGARPEAIAELNRKGFTCYKADKGPGSVNNGIKNVRRWKVKLDTQAINTKKEYNMYKFKKAGNKVTEDVIKAWDDSMDAIRYALDYVYNTHVVPRQSGGMQVYTFDF